MRVLRVLLLLAAGVCVVAACAPSPTQPVTVAPSVGVQSIRPTPAARTPGSPSATSSAPSSRPPAATIIDRREIEASALAVGRGVVWYLRAGSAGGIVGRIDTSSGAMVERPAGPAPVALVATTAALFLLEGMPDPPSAAPRTNAIERLDPETLDLMTGASVRADPTSVAVAGSTVLVAGIRGEVSAYTIPDLSLAWASSAGGRGASQLAASAGSAWLLTGDVDQAVYRLREVAVGNGALGDPVEIPGSGTDGLLAARDSPWVAAVVQDGTRTALVNVAGGVPAEPVSAPRVAAIEASGATVWWLTAEGQLNRATTTDRAGVVSVGSGGVALAMDPDGSIWASTGTEIVHLRP